MRRALLLLLPVTLMLGGCPWVPKPETSVVDTFCLTAQKRKWSIEDSPDSIADAQAWNLAIDRRCGAKKV